MVQGSSPWRPTSSAPGQAGDVEKDFSFVEFGPSNTSATIRSAHFFTKLFEKISKVLLGVGENGVEFFLFI